MKFFCAFILCQFASSIVPASDFAERSQHNWHQWRGPTASGVAPHAEPPLRWDEQTNVRWKVEVPGEGSATPIVWDDRVFVLTAIETDRMADQPPQADATAKTSPPKNVYQFVVLCLDRATGATRWRQIACEEVPHEGRHSTNTYASASPTTDGRRLYVSFGSRGVFCFDLDGTLLWKRNFGRMRTRYGWGEATSPVVHGDRLVLNWDQEENSFVEVLESHSGETRWKADRDEPTSWSTPLLVEHQGRVQAVVNGTNRIRSYDLATGEVIWLCGGLTVNAIPSPVVGNDVVFCMSGYRTSAAFAIPLDATGDITGTDKVAWSCDQGTPYVPSPTLYGGQLYFTRSNSAVLTCLNAADGTVIFGPERLPDLNNVYASPTAAAGRIYFTGRDGATVVIQHGPKLDVLAVNRLDDPIDASPALVGRQLFLRGANHVYCIETESASHSP
jgi:outer membrane protein assembly factor BamB